MVRIAIVEDEEEYRDQLQSYLQKYEREIGQAFEVTMYSDGDGIISDYKAQYDIIFMDIEMQFMDGMTAAEEIRKRDSNVVIIFITNMSQYAIKGYAVGALDYVLKPVSYFAFAERLKRAIARMHKNESKKITLNARDGMLRVDVDEILYFESQGHTIIVHTAYRNYELSGRMKDFEERLEKDNFFRGNKGYLINLKHVDSVKDGCAIIGSEQLVLSRAKRKDFMEALTAYWGGASS